MAENILEPSRTGGGLLFVDFTFACCQPNGVINLFLPINRCPLPFWTPPVPSFKKYISYSAPESLHDLSSSLKVLHLWVYHLCVVVVHHPDELPDVESPVVVHVCPRHQMVDLCMGWIVTQGSHQTAKLPNADVATFILENDL